MYRTQPVPWVWRLVALMVTAPALAAAAPTPAVANEPSAAAARLEGASWHARAIRDPHRSVVPRRASLSPAGPIRLGAGYGTAAGSARVRAVQRMLRGLGYRPGPVDGRFGPRTAAAVGWFQYKHGLAGTDTVTPGTLALLRLRATGAEPATRRTDARSGDEGERDTERSGTLTSESPGEAAASDGESTGATARDPGSAAGRDFTPLVLALAVLLGLALMAMRMRRSSRTGGDPVQVPAAVALPQPERPAVEMLGYVTLDRDELPEGVPATVLWALDEQCDERGWALSRVIHDVEPESGRIGDRPGLQYALEVIASGRAAGLVALRLRDLTTSVSDLGPLIRWFDEADARLVVLGAELDTGADTGRRMAQTLAEVSGWERRRIVERTRNGLAASRSSRKGTSREAVRDDPELAARIGRMREEGMSLQAIADRLNAEGVPTRRGGSRWRPSSVQTAAGYQRPTARQGARDLPPVNGGEP